MRYSIATVALLSSGFAIAAPFEINPTTNIDTTISKTNVLSGGNGDSHGLIPSVFHSLGLGDDRKSKDRSDGGSRGSDSSREGSQKGSFDDGNNDHRNDDNGDRHHNNDESGDKNSNNNDNGDKNQKNDDDEDDHHKNHDNRDSQGQDTRKYSGKGSEGYGGSYSQDPSYKDPTDDLHQTAPNTNYGGRDPQDKKLGGHHDQDPNHGYDNSYSWDPTNDHNKAEPINRHDGKDSQDPNSGDYYGQDSQRYGSKKDSGGRDENRGGLFGLLGGKGLKNVGNDGNENGLFGSRSDEDSNKHSRNSQPHDDQDGKDRAHAKDWNSPPYRTHEPEKYNPYGQHGSDREHESQNSHETEWKPHWQPKSPSDEDHNRGHEREHGDDNHGDGNRNGHESRKESYKPVDHSKDPDHYKKPEHPNDPDHDTKHKHDPDHHSGPDHHNDPGHHSDPDHHDNHDHSNDHDHHNGPDHFKGPEQPKTPAKNLEHHDADHGSNGKTNHRRSHSDNKQQDHDHKGRRKGCLTSAEAESLRDKWASFFEEVDEKLAEQILLSDFQFESQGTSKSRKSKDVDQGEHCYSQNDFIQKQKKHRHEKIHIEAWQPSCDSFTFRWSSKDKYGTTGSDLVYVQKGSYKLEKATRSVQAGHR